MSTAPFYTQLPWAFITSLCDGVVVQKDGILQRSFVYRAAGADARDVPPARDAPASPAPTRDAAADAVRTPPAIAAVTAGQDAPATATAGRTPPPAPGDLPLSVKLSQAHILNLAANVKPKSKDEKDGSGRSVDFLAKKYGIAASTFYRARFILKSASPGDIAAVKEGKLSINAAYKKYKNSAPVV
ncbi:MAG: hypothetical protein LBF83_06130 [Spirochaetaceae bacterium]|jgi:hypothetical protein|nr:hypothetical protein [Spirochaetaceae bacterium]